MREDLGRRRQARAGHAHLKSRQRRARRRHTRGESCEGQAQGYGEVGRRGTDLSGGDEAVAILVEHLQAIVARFTQTPPCFREMPLEVAQTKTKTTRPARSSTVRRKAQSSNRRSTLKASRSSSSESVSCAATAGKWHSAGQQGTLRGKHTHFRHTGCKARRVERNYDVRGRANFKSVRRL